MSALIAHGVASGFCGIDVGTSGVRAVVVTADGTCVGSGRAVLPPGNRTADQHEQDADDWWDALVIAVRGAIAQAGSAVQIVCVAVDATSGTVLVQDPSGAARGPALMYDDGRAAAQAQRAQQVGAPLWDALGYRMQPSWALPKLMWLLEHDAIHAGDQVVHQSDFLVRRLTGEPVPTDSSHALKMGVDLRDISWPQGIFTELGIDPSSVLPEVVLSGSHIGAVSAAGAAATGLPIGATVRAGMTDGCAAQIATGALRLGSWSSALGTTLVIKGSTAELIRDPQGAVYCHRSPDGGWLPGGASSTGAGAIAQQFPAADSDELGRLTAQARSAPPVAGVTYALAGSGERFPFTAPQAHGFLAGDATSDPQRFAALCQSIAYIERLSYEVLATLGAEVSGPVAFTGGANGNSWWNQLRADTLGRPAFVPASAQAATGMAILAAARPGELAATAHKMVQIGARYTPDPVRTQNLQPGYVALIDELVDRRWLAADVAGRVLSTAGSST